MAHHVFHIEIHTGAPHIVPSVAGEIALAEHDDSAYLVLKSSSDHGLNLLDRAFENDRIFRKDLESRGQEFQDALLDVKSLVGLAPMLQELGALPLTVFQLESLLRKMRVLPDAEDENANS